MKTSSSFAAFLATLLVASAAGAQQLPPPAIDNPKPSVPTKPADDETSPLETPDDTVIVVPPETPSVPLQPKPKPSAKSPRKSTSSISVGGVDVTDLSQAASIAKLKRAFDGQLQQSVALWDGTQFRAVRRFELGVSIPYGGLLKHARARRVRGKSVNVPLRFEVDARRAQAALRALQSEINVGARTQRVEIALSGSAQRIERGLEATSPSTRIELVTRRVAISPPQSTAGAASNAVAGYPYLLASFSTPYDAKIRGRTNNLRMAAKLVNGTIVAPDATFSANQSIGPRNAKAGWREAKMFIDGRVVNGIGSGICQCSTTIYNAALLAGLPIIERHPHSFRVMYAPASRDAAIYWGQKDMRFRNTSGGAIYVQTFLRAGRFHARLFGTAPRTNDVRVESRIVSRSKGTRSEAYRVIKTATGEERRRLSRDYYKPHP